MPDMVRSLAPQLSHALLATLLATCIAGHSLAQEGPGQNEVAAAARETSIIILTQEQRDTIYQSVRSDRSSPPAPQGTQVALGIQVPSNVQLSPMPATAARLVPEARGMQVTLVDKRVIVVEPGSRKIIAIIGFDEKRDLIDKR